MEPLSPKPVVWMGTSRKDVGAMPELVRSDIGYALYAAQTGGKHHLAKPLRGFSGAGVVEIVADHRGDTFRCVYTVRIASVVYVLHAFQKRSPTGIKTPAQDMETVKRRLRDAELLARTLKP